MKISLTGSSRLLASAMLAAWLAGPALAADVVVQPGPGDGFVVTDNTGAIERLRVDEATGNVSKDGTLFLHTKGGSTSAFVGEDAGAANATCCNAAFGYRALNANSSGYLNSAFGYEALRSNLGLNNSAFGASALLNNTTGASNSAFGSGALLGDAAAPDKSNNSAFGYRALYVNRADGNSAFGANALDANTTGSGNVAVGVDALGANTWGFQNAAFGYQSLYSNTEGQQSSAFGYQSLYSNTEGQQSSAFGHQSLYSNTTGSFNVAFGNASLKANTTGNANAAFGIGSLYSSTGSSNTGLGSNSLGGLESGQGNIAVGSGAGSSLTSGNYNIYISTSGTSTESGQIRIGNSTNHTDAFIAGIDGNVVTGNAVFVTSSGELGVAASSIRFKQAVRDMEDASLVLAKLRPVTFRYREEVADGGELLQYGLIAEEVAEVEPGLVAYDEEGRPYSVRYQFLAPMLVNEYQKQQRTIEEQTAQIARQEARIGSQETAIEQLTARLERLEAEAGNAGRAVR